VINFDTSREDDRLIGKIADRVMKVNPSLDRMTVEMDLTACHLNGTPLDLQRMLDTPRDFDVMHDVYGIAANLDRSKTGKLTGLFRPRFAQRETV
jgi:hypothetical protein